MKDVTIIGKTNWRNTNQLFGIKDRDRLGHIYAIGKTGTGKSTLLLNLAISDIQRGNGICIIDPHGDLAQTILKYIPEHRMRDVIYFNAPDTEFPIGFNALHAVHPKYHHLVASSLIGTFKKIWIDSWGPRLEHILRFSLLTLLCYPSATLLDIQPLLTDPFLRTKVLNHVSDPAILAFWQNEYDKYTPALRSEAISPILNKTGLLIASLPLRNIVGQVYRRFSMHEVLDKSMILICNVSKGEIGEEASALLGSMILTSIQTAALFRSSYESHKRVPFYLYVDEMHTFVTRSFADILAESRKYGLSLFLTHQYVEQIPEEIRSAIFGNVGTMISFRIGAADAVYLAKEFAPIFSESDLVHLPKYAMYLKVMIDGATSQPFSAQSLNLSHEACDLTSEIIALARTRYARPLKQVEKELRKPNISVSDFNKNTLF